MYVVWVVPGVLKVVRKKKYVYILYKVTVTPSGGNLINK